MVLTFFIQIMSSRWFAFSIRNKEYLHGFKLPKFFTSLVLMLSHLRRDDGKEYFYEIDNIPSFVDLKIFLSSNIIKIKEVLQHVYDNNKFILETYHGVKDFSNVYDAVSSILTAMSNCSDVDELASLMFIYMEKLGRDFTSDTSLLVGGDVFMSLLGNPFDLKRTLGVRNLV